MATPSWQVGGQYYETCSCDFVCPCLPGQMAVSPSKESCTWVAALTGFVLLEKIGPAGAIVARVSGIALMFAGVLLIAVKV